MKKIAICLSFLLSTTLVGCTSYGDTFTEDEFVYKHIGDGSVDIIGYEGTSSEITIPLSISHLGTTYKVRNVESLNENKYIKKVIMPQTDEMFYEFECFENCSNLKEIETHNQLYNGLSFKGTSLGDAIYSSDSTILYAVNQSLEEFKVSNKTKTIESHAFERCMVEKVHIPNGVEDMHEYCFVDCKYLATIDTICTYYEPRSYTKEELFAGTEFEGEDFIPAAYMRNIMENMHLDWDGEKYVEMIDNSNRLPITVKQVPYCLFYGCHSIEDFTFDQFERIGLVFSDCSRLT